MARKRPGASLVARMITSAYDGGLLHFRVGASSRTPDFAGIIYAMSRIEYNDFDGQEVANFLHANEPNILYMEFGREFSPVLYIQFGKVMKVDRKALDEVTAMFASRGSPPSEVSFDEDREMARFWWD